MKKIFSIIAAIVSFSMAFVISSCNKTDDDTDLDVHEVELKFEGATATPGMFMQKIVEMNGEGGGFTIETTGKYADKGYLMAMSLDGKIESVPDAFAHGAPYFEDVNVFSGDWGSISYLSGRSPFKIKVVVKPNDSAFPREINIQLGEERTYTIVTVRQHPDKALPDVPVP